MFFLSGGEIDGEGNINLVSVGDYDRPTARFPGSFGSAYLYYVVPKVILFRTEHSKRTLVPKVSLHQRAGRQRLQRPPQRRADRADHQPLPVFVRPERGAASRCESVHPGHTLAEVIVNTGFEFDRPPDVPVTPAPSPETLRLLREIVAPELAEVYPQFAAKVFVRKFAPHPRCEPRASKDGYCTALLAAARTMVSCGPAPARSSAHPRKSREPRENR